MELLALENAVGSANSESVGFAFLVFDGPAFLEVFGFDDGFNNSFATSELGANAMSLAEEVGVSLAFSKCNLVTLFSSNLSAFNFVYDLGDSFAKLDGVELADGFGEGFAFVSANSSGLSGLNVDSTEGNSDKSKSNEKLHTDTT